MIIPIQLGTIFILNKNKFLFNQSSLHRHKDKSIIYYDSKKY